MKMICSKAVVIRELEHDRSVVGYTGGHIDRRLITYNGRYYTVYGRMFAVRGDQWDTPWTEVCLMDHYLFGDWNNLSDMYRDER